MDSPAFLFLAAVVVVPLLWLASQWKRRPPDTVEYVNRPAPQDGGEGQSDEHPLEQWVQPVGPVAGEEHAYGPAVRVAGKDLVCAHCESTEFYERHAQLNTPVATFFGFDWANRSATCFVCVHCGRVEWFLL